MCSVRRRYHAASSAAFCLTHEETIRLEPTESMDDLQGGFSVPTGTPEVRRHRHSSTWILDIGGWLLAVGRWIFAW